MDQAQMLSRLVLFQQISLLISTSKLYLTCGGDATIKTPISCNDVEIEITQNLYDALWHLRLPHMPRLVWVDAICINQYDVEERNQQVSIMHRIFSQASMVAVWLGRDKGENLHLAIAAMNLIYQRCVEHTAIQNSSLAGMSFSQMESINIVENIPLDDAFDSETWTSLSRFFARPWFERVWCVQEIILAKQGMILTDTCQVPWERVGTSAMILTEQMTRPMDYSSHLRHRDVATTCILAAQLHFHEGKSTLLGNLELFRNRKAMDPRDLVYGLLGLQDDQSRGCRLEPDYNKTTSEVYVDVVRTAINDYDGLGFLSSVQHEDSFRQLTGFPSWAPYWPRTRCVSFLDRGSWCAGGQQAIRVSFPSQTNMLAEGIVYEKICFVGGIHPAELDAYGSPHPFPDLILELWRNLVSLNPQVETFRDRLEKLGRTLTAGYTGSGDAVYQLDEHPRSNFYADYLAFIQHIHKHTGHKIQTPDLPCLETFEGVWERYAGAVDYACRGRRLFRTTNGSLGLGPACTSIGDVVSVLQGGKVPYVLRPDGDSYHFLGECYIDNIMRGELFRRDVFPHLKQTVLSLK